MGDDSLDDLNPLAEEAAQGRIFVCKDQNTTRTAVLAQTAFVDTTPTFLINSPAAGNKYKKIIESFILEQLAPAAGGVIVYEAWWDAVARYVSGGTRVDPKCIYNYSDVVDTVDFDFWVNPTVAARSASAVRIDSGRFTASVDSMIDIDPDEDMIIGPGVGSLAIYLYAATTAPSFHYEFRVIQKDN